MLGGSISGEDVVDGAPVIVPLKAEAGGGIGLRVAVNQQDFKAFQRETCSEIDSCSGFANAALLVDNTENLTHGNQE